MLGEGSKVQRGEKGQPADNQDDRDENPDKQAAVGRQGRRPEGGPAARLVSDSGPLFCKIFIIY
jgi:hypothetical protein